MGSKTWPGMGLNAGTSTGGRDVSPSGKNFTQSKDRENQTWQKHQYAELAIFLSHFEQEDTEGNRQYCFYGSFQNISVLDIKLYRSDPKLINST